MKKIIFLFLISASLITKGNASEISQSIKLQIQEITAPEYINLLELKNGTLLAKKLSLKGAESQLHQMSAPVINPNVTLSRGAYFGQTPYTPFVSPASNTFTFGGVLEGMGKRAAREEYAKAELVRTQSDMEFSKKAIAGDAIFAYLDTLRTKLAWKSYQDGIDRFNAIGDKETKERVQSIQATVANDFKFFSFALNNFVGRNSSTLLEPMGSIAHVLPKEFKVEELLSNAMKNRADVLNFEDALKVADANIKLTEKNRNIDLMPSLWTSRTPSYIAGGNQYDPSVAYGVSLMIPIPVHLLQDNDRVQAANNKANLEINFQDLKSRILTEINQSFLLYDSAKQKYVSALSAFDEAKQKKNDKTVDGITTYLDREIEFNDAKINHAKSQIYLLRVSGFYELPNLE
jgi:Outer membrane efflux protein